MAHLMNNNSNRNVHHSYSKGVHNKKQSPKTVKVRNNKRSQKIKSSKRKSDNIITFNKNDKIFGVVSGIIAFILIISFIGVNSWKNNIEEKIGMQSVGQTYYQYLTQQKNDNQKEKEDTNVKNIAERLIKEEVGLSANNQNYSKTGVYNKGVFIDSAIISGNGIPKTTNFSGTATDYHTILEDSGYFKNIRQSQYNEMKQKAEENISDNDKAKQDLSDMQNQINQARKDAGALKDNQHKDLANKKINNAKENSNEQ